MTTKAELQKQIDEWVDQGKQLKEQIDALPDDKPVPAGRWKPKYDDEYWIIKDGAVTDNCWYNDSIDLAYFALASVYRTEEEAQAALDQQLATVRVLDRIAELNAGQGWVCDWDDHDQIKYIFRFDHDDRTFYFGSTYLSRWHQSQYFGSKQTIETVIKEMRSDCLLMLGVER